MKGIIAFFVIILLSINVFSQSITFSSKISTNDSDIQEIENLWKAYIESERGSNGWQRISSEYWNKDEISKGFSDIARSYISMPYIIGNTFVYDIEEIENGYYMISNKWNLPNDTTCLYKFNVCAKFEENQFRLYNNFYFIKQKLNNYHSKHFNYYYPSSYPFNKAKAMQAGDFFQKIIVLYGDPDYDEMIYLLGSNLKEANKLIGFDYSFIESSSPYAGNTRSLNNLFFILAGTENNLHEITHTVFSKLYPNASFLFHEGVATYYGGLVNKSYSDFMMQMKDLLKENNEIDLSDFKNLDKNINNGKFNNYYFIGAILVDYALKKGGTNKVISLFKYPISNNNSFDEVFLAIKKELGVDKKNLNTFLKEYILDYKP